MRGRANTEGYELVMRLREETGMGSKRLSDATGISVGTISNWIYSGRDPHYRSQMVAEYRNQPLPKTKRCTKCLETKNVSKEFAVTADGRSGGMKVSSRCRKCLNKIHAARRAGMDPEKLKSLTKQYERTRSRKKRTEDWKARRVPKEPLLALIAEERTKKEHLFVRPDRGGSNAHGRKSSSFTGVFDLRRFAAYLGLEWSEFESLDRISREGTATTTVDIDLADRIYTELGQQTRFLRDYPKARSGSSPDQRPDRC